MSYLLGIDLSATGAKALIINIPGEVIAVESTPSAVFISPTFVEHKKQSLH